MANNKTWRPAPGTNSENIGDELRGLREIVAHRHA